MFQKTVILVLFSTIGFALNAQWTLPSTGCSIRYDYDAAGNRTSRYWYCWGTTPPGMVQTEGATSDGTTRSSVNLDSVLTKLSLHAYPNPARDIFILELSAMVDQAQVTVYDARGMRVLQTSMTGSLMEIDITQWAHGLYHVCLIRNEEMFVVDVIKE